MGWMEKGLWDVDESMQTGTGRREGGVPSNMMGGRREGKAYSRGRAQVQNFPSFEVFSVLKFRISAPLTKSHDTLRFKWDEVFCFPLWRQRALFSYIIIYLLSFPILRDSCVEGGALRMWPRAISKLSIVRVSFSSGKSKMRREGDDHSENFLQISHTSWGGWSRVVTRATGCCQN
jgi:hypothetical protein